MREAQEGLHRGELAGAIEPQSRNAFPCRSNGRFSEPLLAAIDEGREDVLLHTEILSLIADRAFRSAGKLWRDLFTP